MNISVPRVVLKPFPSFDEHLRLSSLRVNLWLVRSGFQVNIAKLLFIYECQTHQEHLSGLKNPQAYLVIFIL